MASVVPKAVICGLTGRKLPLQVPAIGTPAVGAGAVAKQQLEKCLLVRGIDHQDFADPGQHEHAERVINHRLVVHRQQLLADRLGDRIQARAGTTGEDDAFPIHAAAPIRSRR